MNKITVRLQWKRHFWVVWKHNWWSPDQRSFMFNSMTFNRSFTWFQACWNNSNCRTITPFRLTLKSFVKKGIFIGFWQQTLSIISQQKITEYCSNSTPFRLTLKSFVKKGISCWFLATNTVYHFSAKNHRILFQFHAFSFGLEAIGKKESLLLVFGNKYCWSFLSEKSQNIVQIPRLFVWL